MKKQAILVLVMVAIIGVIPVCKAAPVEWAVADGGNGHYYERIDVPGGITWPEADVVAQSHVFNQTQGYLATITSETENTFIVNNFLVATANPMQVPADGYFIGGFQNPFPGGDWHWVSDEVWNYTHWRPGPPEPTGDGPALLIYSASPGSIYLGWWNDLPMTAVDYGYIVEYVPEPAGPVAYWSFDDAGDPGHDDSGNGHDGTVLGVTSVGGVCGNALSFDGIDDYVDIPGTSGLHLHSGLTLSAWVKFDNEENIIVGKHVGAIDSGYFLGAYDGKLCFYVDNTGLPGGVDRLKTAQPYNDNQWHHVVGVYDGVSQYLYVDGVLEGKQNHEYVSTNSANVMISGAFHKDSYYIVPFSGIIDEVRIYNRALSAGEIAEFAVSCDPIEQILDFIDESVGDGTLAGDGPGKSADGRLNALINMIEAAGNLIDAGDPDLLVDACWQLQDAYNRTDGNSPPPDFVIGDSASELASKIAELMASLECE